MKANPSKHDKIVEERGKGYGGMSKLDDLIKEYCPNGVEYKQIKDIATTYSGLSGKTKDDFGKGFGKFITYKDVYDNTHIFEPSGRVEITDKDKKQNRVCKGDLLVTTSSETKQDSGHFGVYLREDEPYLNSFCFGIRLKIDRVSPEYLAYLLNSDDMHRLFVDKCVNGEIRYNVSKKQFLNLEIPIPPLPIQEYIVSILEPLESYTAELTAELTLRKKQYKGILDKVMSEAPETRTMKDLILTHSKGTGITKKELTSTGTPCLRYSKLHEDIPIGIETTTTYTQEVKNSKWSEYGDLMIADASETIDGLGDGKVNLVGDILIGGDIINIKHNENPLYLGYAYEYARKQLRRGQPLQVQIFHCYAKDIEKLTIPYYPKEEQDKIAGYLSAIDNYTKDMQKGLPRVIELYKQKYEYNLTHIMSKLRRENEQ